MPDNFEGKFVYIAGPMDHGDTALNIRRAILVADALLKEGHYPYVPHLDHFWHMICPGTREQWLKLDMAFIAKCDCLLRIAGDSPGADLEVAEAQRLGVPVYGPLVVEDKDGSKIPSNAGVAAVEGKGRPDVSVCSGSDAPIQGAS